MGDQEGARSDGGEAFGLDGDRRANRVRAGLVVEGSGANPHLVRRRFELRAQNHREGRVSFVSLDMEFEKPIETVERIDRCTAIAERCHHQRPSVRDDKTRALVNDLERHLLRNFTMGGGAVKLRAMTISVAV